MIFDICWRNMDCTMRTQSCLAPPVSSHAAADSHPGRPDPHPGVQRFVPGRRCLRTYPEPEGTHVKLTLKLLGGERCRTAASNTTHLCLHKFIPVVVWEGAVEKHTNVFMIKRKTDRTSFFNPLTVCLEPVGPTGP